MVKNMGVVAAAPGRHDWQVVGDSIFPVLTHAFWHVKYFILFLQGGQDLGAGTLPGVHTVVVVRDWQTYVYKSRA